jgi:hypothetical protein
MNKPQVLEQEVGTARQVVAQAHLSEDSQGQALAPQPVAASPLDLPAEQFRAGLDRRRENRAALMEWVRAALVEGSDYGRIHVVGRNKCPHGNRCQNPAHFSKPSLFKPGAEKICGMLGVSVHFPSLHDYEQSALQGVELHHIIVRCELQDAAGRVVADGVGARSLNQDYGDINKALKMAEKSAHIDATLRMAGLSEVFTQDLEDMVPEGMGTSAGKPAASASPQAVDPNTTQITGSQLEQLAAHIQALGLDPARIKAWLFKASHGRVQQFEQLTPALYSSLEGRLEAWAERTAIQEESQ